jgi:hypothetical protein
LSGISVSSASSIRSGSSKNGRHRRLFPVRQRQEIDQPAHLDQRLDVVLEGPVGDRGFLRVGRGAAQLLRRDISLVTVFTTSGPVTNM